MEGAFFSEFNNKCSAWVSGLRRLFAIVAMAVCAFFAGCEINVNSPWPQVELDGNVQIERTIDPRMGINVSIRGGSGQYSAQISDRAVANVHVADMAYYGAGFFLVVEPKNEGDAVITVTDSKSGHFARCFLKVTKYSPYSLKISDVRWSIDADTPQAIEADLKADTSIPPIGGSILWGVPNYGDEWAFTDADGKKFARGTMAEEFREDNPIFGTLLPQMQITRSERWILSYEGGMRRKFDMLVSDISTGAYPATPSIVIGFMQHKAFLCEDLTDYYKTKFPDAGVRSVARVLTTPNGL